MTENTYGPPPQVPLHEVEWRIDGKPVQRGDDWRVRYVPYIDARWLAHGLDEWVGPENWRRDFAHVTFRGIECVVCTVEIRFGDEWVPKPDIGLIEGGGQTGTKGTYSDAFKRSACVAWGVGRNVYDLPGDIWAQCNVRKGKNDQWQAYPHPAAVLQIRDELAKRGHEILHLTAEPKVGGPSADTDVDPDVETLDDEQVAAIRDAFAPLTGETRKLATAEWFATWGKAEHLTVDRYDDALADAAATVARHTPPAEDTPPPGQAAEPDGGEAEEPSSAVGLTFDEIDAMSARGLAEHLAQFDLDLTGNMAAKRKRLKDAVAAQQSQSGPGATMDLWKAGAMFPAHPETGEALDPIETYVVGIEKYEEALSEPLTEAWNEWLAGAFPDSGWPPDIQYVAFTAYQTIHHLHTTGGLP